MLADMLVPGLPVSPSGAIYEHERHQLALSSLHQGDRFVTFVHCSEAAGEKHDGIRMPDEDQLSCEEIFKGDEFFVLANNRVGALLPRQAYVCAETFLWSGAFVAGLHDASACARDHHESGLGNLLTEVSRLLVFLLGGLHARRAKNGHFPRLGIRRKQPERVPQLAQGRLDNPYVSTILDISENLESALNNVCNALLVVTAAFKLNQFLDPTFQFGVGRFFRLYHDGKTTVLPSWKATALAPKL